MILGIETSCDETAAAVVTDDGEIVANVVASQAELHARFGGVVPEVASRRHLELIVPVLDEALDGREVDAIAVTTRPGLIGALLVGVSAAKALAWARRLPLRPVDHLHGHVASLYLRPLDLQPPFTCLLASGGHTMLLDVRDRGGYRVLGTTLDDAAGEAFDKGARLLGLGYPGGSAIDRLAKEGDPHAYDFPVARVPGLDFSFSGLKTALLYAVRDLSPADLDARRADLAASYQRAIVRALVERLEATRSGTGRRRRRSRCELRAACVAAGRGARSARALHRQRRDDRLGRALHRGRPVPGVPFARCASDGRLVGSRSACSGSPRSRPRWSWLSRRAGRKGAPPGPATPAPGSGSSAGRVAR